MARKFSQICPKHMKIVLMFLGVFAFFSYVTLWYVQEDVRIYETICNMSQITNRFINDSYAACLFSKLVARKATAADPELIRLIRYMMDPPSKDTPKIQVMPPKTPQHNVIDSILNHKRKGFYVECGAFDGQVMSNTIHFELERQWTGLLVEMDPKFYARLLQVRRNAWSINACLSPKKYATQLAYKPSKRPLGKLISSDPPGRMFGPTRLVPCLPLHAILIALNRTTVDYFSLDVEGFEFDILRTIPFSEVNIRTMSVEYLHGRTDKKLYLEYMAEQGYQFRKKIHFYQRKPFIHADDFIFVKRTKNGSVISEEDIGI